MRVNLRGPALVLDALQPLATAGGAALVVASVAAHGFEPPTDIIEVLRRGDDPMLAERLPGTHAAGAGRNVAGDRPRGRLPA